MEVLFIILNDLSYLDDILEIFVKHKVRGATILDSEGMAKAIVENEGNNLLFGGMFDWGRNKKVGESKTIFTVIPEKEAVISLVDDIREALIDESNKVVGFMFTLPVSGIYPLKYKHKKKK